MAPTNDLSSIVSRLTAFFAAVGRVPETAVTDGLPDKVYITRLSPESVGEAERHWPRYVAAAQQHRLAISMTVQHHLAELAFYTEAGATPAVRSESSRNAYLYLRPLA